MSTTPTQDQPAPVPQSATQAGDIRARWAWVEATVWNARMLTALETGVKGGKWFSLIDKVYALPNLRAACARVQANAGAAGVDRQTIERFEAHLDTNLQKLADELRAGTYQPRPVRRTWIEKLGKRHEKRPLGIPTIRDRVVQTALRNVLEPIFEKDFAVHSYGFRPGRGCKDALRRVVELLQAGYRWVVDADLKSYFDSIPHPPLLERVREKVSDGRILDLVSAYLQQPVMESHKQWTPPDGTPQGAVLSPVLSNLYLHPLDRLMADRGIEMVRYADDFVLLCRSEADAHRALAQVQAWTVQAGLTLHPDKTRIGDTTAAEGFEFLGYHCRQGQRWPRRKSLQKLKDTLRRKTKRTSGISLTLSIANVNRTTIGWFEYFQHSHPRIFPRLDGWIRMRLRSILRKRLGRKGRGRGRDHQRWPNAFFAKQGLFSLTTAHALACQSSRR